MQAVQVIEEKSKISSSNNRLIKRKIELTRVTYLHMLSHNTGHYIIVTESRNICLLQSLYSKVKILCV